MERAIIRPSDLFDNGLSTDRVEIFEPRLFRQGVALGDHQNRLIFCFHRRLYGSDRPFTSDRQGHHDPRDQYGALNR
jgi:hypothetical protein